MKLQDKVIVITGASRGIGRALSLEFARQGATVVATARRERGPGSLEDTVGQVERDGGKALAVTCDLTVAQDVKSMVDRTLGEFGRIDVLVNNAGISNWNYIEDLSVEEWDSVIAVNLRGVFLACKYALPSMVERRSGHIINVSAEMNGRPLAIAYAASKAALTRLTLDLAGQMQEHNVALNVFLPGFLDTEIIQNGPGLSSGRVPDPVEMVVPSALWLAQQDASTVTGQLVHRDNFGQTWGPGSSG